MKVNPSSRAVAVDCNAVKVRSKPIVSVASAAPATGVAGARQSRTIDTATTRPPDSMDFPFTSKFKLPRNTTGRKLLEIGFLQAVFETAVQCKCVRRDEWRQFVGLAVNVVAVEPKTPAKLFTWAMRTGKRVIKVGSKTGEVRWQAAIRNEDDRRAVELISGYSRTSQLQLYDEFVAPIVRSLADEITLETEPTSKTRTEQALAAGRWSALSK